MSKLATLAMAAGALALTFVALAPSSAEAGWRRGYWGWGPGVGVYAGPGCCWYGGYYGYGYGYPYAYYPYWRGKRYWRRYW